MEKSTERVEELKEMAQLYAQNIDEYEEQFAGPAMKRAEELEAQQKELSRGFSSTKVAAENPLRASNAYKEIADALRNASEAAEAAHAAAEAAFAEAENSMMASVDESLNTSTTFRVFLLAIKGIK